MKYQAMRGLKEQEYTYGFRSKNGLIKIIPSSQAKKFYWSIIDRNSATVLYSQNAVDGCGVSFFLCEYGYNIDDLEMFKCKTIDNPNGNYLIENNKVTNLYIIQAVNGGPIKIGVAQSISSRLTQLQTGNPYKLQVVKMVLDVPPKFEGKLHKIYERYRISGEWFDEIILCELLELLEKLQEYECPSNILKMCNSHF